MNNDSTSGNQRLVLWSLLLTIVFEALTCVLRFGLELQSTRATASTIGWLTGGIRIHHSYIGLAMIVCSCWLWNRRPQSAFWLLAIGLGLLFSDLIHHFVVLWVIVGDPQFDLVYP